MRRCSGGEDSEGNAALARKVLLVDAVLRLVDAAPPPPPSAPLFMNICAVNLSLQPQKSPPSATPPHPPTAQRDFARPPELCVVFTIFQINKCTLAAPHHNGHRVGSDVLDKSKPFEGKLNLM